MEVKTSKEMDEFINKLDSLCWEYQMEIKPTHPVPDDEVSYSVPMFFKYYYCYYYYYYFMIIEIKVI